MQQRKLLRRWVMRITLMILVILVAFLVIAGYSWSGSGFAAYTNPKGEYQREKTVWDWLQLAVIPLVLAGLVWWLNKSEQSRQTTLALNRTWEERLQSYLDHMTNLLEKGLTAPGHDQEDFADPLRSLARIRTLTVLRDLDSSRKKIILYFLSNANLISRHSTKISLIDADFVKAHSANQGVTRIAKSEANKALPRRRTLCTNSKKPKYNGSLSCEMPRCGRSHERNNDQNPSKVLTWTSGNPSPSSSRAYSPAE